MSNVAQSPVAAPAARRKALAIVAGVVVAGGLAWGAWWTLVASRVETTDNAYVQGNVVQITPQIPGTVVSINVDDTDVVKAGQPLVRLDPADAQLALDQAQAQLGQTVREVRTMYANNATLKAQIAAREAEVSRAQAEVARLQADLVRAQDDVARRKPLVASGAVGAEEYAHATAQLSVAQSAVAAAKSNVEAARSAVAAAQEQLASNQSMTDGTPVEQHPNVLRAAARVREAWLAVKRADLLAPTDGVVARRSVQVGQRVAAGAPLLTVVALDKLWVDANFKEGQLQRMHVGQPAKLTADVYGRKVEYSGRVVGLGAGTGAAFALLPAQNATGNWIKVVQRVPVRIALDPKELAAHPLRVGLSMDVSVDVSKADGPPLTAGERSQPVAQTSVFDALAREADAEVQRIVKANLGSRVRALR
ncbi:HlyD family efflux transporter periplasmic adaptor subunit [Aquabacterium sp.]|uniref:HlyD family secretion protein n=1 Tax=Aquabacterium sp. TaxID=1872578 RepID=UPI003784F401